MLGGGQGTMSKAVLSGWKEIAEYLGRGVRTAQRWETQYGLPAHRPKGASRSAVFVLVEELEIWLQSTPMREPIIRSKQLPITRSHREPTILVVDDNDIQMYAIRKVLATVGFRVVTASTGSHAIMQAFEQNPHAILLDVNLPDVNGYEVCRRLKAERETSGIPVIFHSASSDSQEARLQAKAVGATAFLTSPVHRQSMIALLKASLDPALWPKDIEVFNFDTEPLFGQKRISI
jgi:CheY-like chemotaxis protein